ncbi:hypothetical protein [Shewanella marina]|uniref:hypothetical protein n=1 Tax=Shewanella marina TaxID=487319 RepID=UPI000A47113A|nr:hypothetical protein [Shewanella marina]
MNEPIKFSRFCQIYYLDEVEQESVRLYQIYRKHAGVFNQAMSVLIADRAIAKARAACH